MKSENIYSKHFEKLISMWSLIRPCWVDFSSTLNRHVDMIVRATRVLQDAALQMLRQREKETVLTFLVLNSKSRHQKARLNTEHAVYYYYSREG